MWRLSANHGLGATARQPICRTDRRSGMARNIDGLPMTGCRHELVSTTGHGSEAIHHLWRNDTPETRHSSRWLQASAAPMMNQRAGMQGGCAGKPIRRRRPPGATGKMSMALLSSLQTLQPALNLTHFVEPSVFPGHPSGLGLNFSGSERGL